MFINKWCVVDYSHIENGIVNEWRDFVVVAQIEHF